jgi:predicted O-linked N-acetylglucosamine transferase (SPINDLY family)
VSGERLVFAERMPSQADHLARHRLAGVALDTLPFNGHSTTIDALWAGLPVITCVGTTFPGRVAASLLGAIGLPDLVAADLDQYEELAFQLASDPERLASIRRRLGAQRLTTPLFDTPRYARGLEAAFTEIHRRHLAGLPPDDIPESVNNS